MSLTEAQELVAASRGGARLVSAAAGSGKTTVLVERLMRYVDEGADINSFLVITYTRAAAGELRSRILEELNKRIAADPHNRRLRRQTDLVTQAGIGTIDSICGRILRENTHLAGIAPDFKVIEPERAEAILRSVVDKELEKLYEKAEDDPGLSELVDTYGTGRDDKALSELVIRIHEAVQAQSHPVEWLRRQREEFDLPANGDAGGTGWGRDLLKSAGAEAAYWAQRMEKLISMMREPGRERLCGAYGETVEAAAEGLRELARACTIGWESARTHCVFSMPKAKPYPKGEYYGEKVKSTRDQMKKALARWQEVFADPSEALLEEMRSTRGAVEALLRLVEQVESAYADEKKRQGVVDFSDQEHMVLALLENGENGLADALSQRYTEVLVDEYQDVNACQDGLFSLLSDHERKLFMVGDVKQSIYRFRLADPTIFLEKYNAWKNADRDTPPGVPGRILLRENFRSRPEILNAANHVFRNIMSEELGELCYDDAAALCPGGNIPAGGAPVEMAVLSFPEETEEERPDKVRREAAWIADKIRALIDQRMPVSTKEGERPLRYGDVAILLRSNKNVTGRYRDVLSSRGIPSVSQQGGGFFRSLEVTVLLSLLAVIDNPRQDIALIAAMRSPLYGFTPDDLSRIRSYAPKMDFYTAVRRAAETEERTAAFLRSLEEYRALAPDLSVEALLGRVCGDTDLFALLSAMPDGHARRENVSLLLDYARQFEQDGHRGLFRFLAWMKRLEERGEERHTGSLDAADAVQIISIHHSKGLEYPVVFLAQTSKKFNTRDLNGQVLIHPELGIGSKVVDTARGVIYPSLAWRALKDRLERETLSEEMRLLYVAMTRARERLYITYMLDKAEEKIAGLQTESASPLPPELLLHDACMGQWLLRCALLPESPIKLSPVTLPESMEVPAPATDKQPPEEDITARTEILRERLVWRYPCEALTTLPSKLTASALPEEESDQEAAALTEKRHPALRRVDFSRTDAPLTGTERGIAVHKVMQCMDHAKGLREEDVQTEIDRLCREGHLTPAQAKAVVPSTVCAFFRSEVGQRVLHADEIWRELRFSLLCPVRDFYPADTDEEVLLQGVVDCCIREGDTLTVIDYKTDGVTEDTIAQRAEHYAPQLRAYAKALERMMGLPVREGALFFLRSGKTVSVAL